MILTHTPWKIDGNKILDRNGDLICDNIRSREYAEILVKASETRLALDALVRNQEWLYGCEVSMATYEEQRKLMKAGSEALRKSKD